MYGVRGGCCQAQNKSLDMQKVCGSLACLSKQLQSVLNQM